MYMHDSLKGQTTIKRRGVIKEVLLPNQKLLSSDITILLGTEQLEFRDGESVFIIDKEIGIKEELHATIFIAGDYLVCEILKGNIYIKEAEQLYCITDTGTRRKSKVYEKDLRWMCLDNFIELITPLIGAKYNISNINLTKQYLDNLSVDVVMKNIINRDEIAGKIEESYMFSLKLIQDYQNFGLEKFDFKVYEKTDVETTKQEAIDSYMLWKKEQAREKKEKEALRKAEQVYLNIKEGEEIVDLDAADYIYSKSNTRKSGIIGDFDDIDDDDIEEDELDEYIEE